MTRNDAIKFVAVRSLGNFLLLFALYGVFATFGPALSYEVKYRIALARGVTFSVADASSTQTVQTQPGFSQVKYEPGFSDVIVGNKEQVLIPKDTQFSILIAKIGASAKVFPNVDPTNESEFLTILSQGVAHAKGSVFPGIKGN